METMRREGFEFQVGRPRVLIKKDESAASWNPSRRPTVRIRAQQYAGKAIEVFGSAGGEMSDMYQRGDQTHLRVQDSVARHDGIAHPSAERHAWPSHDVP